MTSLESAEVSNGVVLKTRLPPQATFSIACGPQPVTATKTLRMRKRSTILSVNFLSS